MALPAENQEALLIGNKAIVSKPSLASQLHQKGFGEKKEKELFLDSKETLFLLERKKIELTGKKNEKIKEKDFLKIASREKNFLEKFLVYSDLRERGFIVKTGYKFGFDFRVYPRGKKPGQAHTQWVVNVVAQEQKISLSEFSRMARLAGNIKTQLVQAVVDSETDINYYLIERLLP